MKTINAYSAFALASVLCSTISQPLEYLTQRVETRTYNEMQAQDAKQIEYIIWAWILMIGIFITFEALPIGLMHRQDGLTL